MLKDYIGKMFFKLLNIDFTRKLSLVYDLVVGKTVTYAVTVPNLKLPTIN